MRRPQPCRRQGGGILAEFVQNRAPLGAIGVLITLALPTRVMEREATAAGFFETPFERVPKIQIITLAELFQGKRPRIPRVDVGATFRTAAREKSEQQGRLL